MMLVYLFIASQQVSFTSPMSVSPIDQCFVLIYYGYLL